MFKFREKLHVAALPTPIHKLERLSAETGVNIWMKRDDISGAEFTGNKIRKLEYIFKDLLDRGFDLVITAGGVQSNHCRATAALAAKVGIKCHIVVNGDPNVENAGNLLLDRIFGAEVTFVEHNYERDGKMEQIAEEAKLAGLKPYLIPIGASNALGSFGYVEAYNEILAFEKEKGVNFDQIVISCGSGGTYAGLLLGSRINGDSRKVTGFSVGDDEEYFVQEILNICQKFIEDYDAGITITASDIRINDKYIGAGYSLSRPDEIEFIKKIARTEGIIVDPVYTGKGFYGLISELASEEFKDCKNILFIHTGGIYGIFSEVEKFNLQG